MPKNNIKTYKYKQLNMNKKKIIKLSLIIIFLSFMTGHIITSPAVSIIAIIIILIAIITFLKLNKNGKNTTNNNRKWKQFTSTRQGNKRASNKNRYTKTKNRKKRKIF